MELSLNKQDMERVIEALLFTSSEPLSIKDLKEKFASKCRYRIYN